MTITTQATKIIVSGNGAQTVFNYNFLIDQADDCALIYTDANGNNNPQSSANFTVTGVGNPAGGTFTFSLGGTPIAAGTSLTFYRSVVYEQEYDPNNQATYYLQALENALDQLELQIQQLAEIASRVLAAPISDQAPQMVFPSAALRANTYAAFDAEGNATCLTLLAGSATVSAAMQGIINEATTADAVADLGATLVLANIYALRTYAGTAPLSLILQGYYVAGDAGGGTFTLVTGDTASADNGGTIIVDLIGRRWYRNLAGAKINVRMFGAKGDGATDDTAAIQAAYTLAGAVGVAVEFTTAVYNTSTAIVVGSNTVTFGNYAKVQTTSATAHIFQLGVNTTATIDNITFKDLYVWATVVKTSGAAFKAMTSLQNTNFLNVKAGSLEDYAANGHRLWNGIEAINSFDRVWADQASFFIAANAGIYCSGTNTTAAAGFQIDAHILFCATGAHVAGAAGGVYFNGEFSDCTTSVEIDTTVSGTINREIFCLPGCVIDSSVNYGFRAESNSMQIFEATGAWFSSTGVGGGNGVGVFIGNHTAVTLFAKMTGCRFFNNQVTALVNDGCLMLLSGNMINQNGAGVVLQGSGSTGSVIVGNSMADQFTANTVGTNTGTSIAITDAGLNNFSIESNNFDGSPVPAITGAIWSAQQSIRNNTGYQTESRGVALINSGANTTAPISHNLVGTPAGFSIVTNDGTTTALKYYVTSVGSTQFTIMATANVTSNVTVYWEANMGINS